MDIISYSKAKKAQETADDVRQQLNQAIADGDQLVEVQQARVDADGHAYATLKQRLDTEQITVSAHKADLNALDQRQTNHENDKNNPHNVTKQQVGLGNVDNVQQIPMSQKGQPNGVATLDDTGKVPSSQLPEPGKDPELVDIRTVDPSYTPQRAINTAGDVTRDMQEQMAKGIGVMAKYIFGSNSRGATGWTSGVDNIGKSGIYYITQNHDGLPISADGYLLHMTNTYVPEVTGAMQLFVPYTQNRVFFRRHNPTQWLAWVELVTGAGGSISGNLVFQNTGTGLQFRRGDLESRMHIADFPEAETVDIEARFFRIANTSGAKEVTIFKGDGTPTSTFKIRDGKISKLDEQNITIAAGPNSPEGSLSAPPGSLYLRTNGELWVKKTGSGNTGWGQVAVS